MDVKDLPKRKRELNRDIRDMITDAIEKFKEDTGLEVSAIYIDSATLQQTDSGLEKLAIMSVDCKVSL